MDNNMNAIFIVDASKREEFLKVSKNKKPINKLLARAEKLKKNRNEKAGICINM